MQVPSRVRIFVCLFALVPLTGCLIGRSRKVAPRLLTTATLQEATLDQLITNINSAAELVKTLNASVEIDVSAGGAKKGKVTDYREVSGYVLVRKPEMLRMFGLVPVVRNRLFDMVSNGKTFELSIPALSKFYVGSNQKASPPSAPLLEQLRPQQIFDALLLRPIAPETEKAVLEQGSETVRDPKTHKEAYAPNYIVLVIHTDERGSYLSRKVVFSRVDMLPHEQYLYNHEGQLVTFTRYEDFANYNGTLFPSRIDIQRPIEELAITLTVTKLRLNEPLTDETFVLTQPPGSKLINLDQRTANAGSQPDQQEQQSRFEQ
jgi:outer membrane lipoprotein-sorting protein